MSPFSSSFAILGVFASGEASCEHPANTRHTPDAIAIQSLLLAISVSPPHFLGYLGLATPSVGFPKEAVSKLRRG